MKSPRVHLVYLITVALVILTSFPVLLVQFGKRPLTETVNRVNSNRPPSNPPTLQADRTSQGRVNEAYGNLPLSFEANEGQADSQVKFLCRGSGHTLFLTSTEAVLTFNGAGYQSTNPRSTAVRMRPVGANPQRQVEALDPLPGKVNYFIGSDSSKWSANIPTYSKIRYKQIYPGVDMVYYGNQKQFEYDFVVSPGTDPAVIALSFQGADQLEIDEQGDLVLQTTGGKLRQRKPFIYQELGGAREEVSGRYVLLSGQRVGFKINPYDNTKSLIIDPTLVYSSYLGGNSSDSGPASIAVDGAGSAYVTGLTSSADFPTTAGAFDTTFNGRADAFVTKLDPAGTSLVYSTYLGGSGFDVGLSIAVDNAGNAYVSGRSELVADFPTTPGAFDTTYNGATDAFVTKLDPAGASLVYSTYMGSSGSDIGFDIVVDAAGNTYVVGGTSSSNFPTTPGAFDTTYNGNFDCFVTKLDPAGTSLVYSTYLGGSGTDSNQQSIAVDGAGNVYVTGLTGSADFPTTPGAFDTTYNGTGDGFVFKLNPAGSSLAYSTYLGGSGFDYAHGIAVDGAGNTYVIGYTESGDFPTTTGAFDTTYNGNGDGFVTKLDPIAASLAYSTYLGGSVADQGLSIAVDTAGNGYLTGHTNSGDFPTTPGTLDSTVNGGSIDAFVTKLNSTGAALVLSTYLGGSGQDSDCNIAVDGAGNAYVTGTTSSADFPTPGGFDTTFNGATDVFVAKIEIGEPPNQPPIANCRSVSRFADNSCQAAVSPQEVDNGSSDPEVGTIVLTLDPPGPYPIGTTTVALTVTDLQGASSTCYTTITIENPNPGPTITGPASGAIIEVDNPVNFTGTFIDNVGDLHTAQWTLNSSTQNITQTGIVNEPAGSVSATQTFTSAGVYLVTLTVTDACGNTATANTVDGLTAMVVVYDPDGGFVTGGGWINSPAGAYTSDPSLFGKASFGFVSTYQPGATVPTGNTEFQFRVANFNFKSSSYDWLVVAGAKAQYKGSGTVNGTGDYRFILTAIDGEVTGGGGVDRFRIRIWNNTGGGIVYDNQMNAPDNSDPTTVLGGGSIVIHKQ